MFKVVDFVDFVSCEVICEGIDGIIYFGGYLVEGIWDQIFQVNIIGGYNLFEVVYCKGVKCVVFVLLNYVVGFYLCYYRIGIDVML